MTKKLSNEQKVFNKSYRFIVKQGAPSVNEMGNCVNVSPDGKRCAVACLLNKKELEEVRGCIVTARNKVLSKYEKNTGSLSSLMCELQRAHDSSVWNPQDFVDLFKKKAARIAADYKLTVPEVE